MMIFAPVYYRLKSEHGGKSETVTDIMLRSKKRHGRRKAPSTSVSIDLLVRWQQQNCWTCFWKRSPMFPSFQGCDIIHAAGKYFLRIRYIESFCSGEISPGQLADQQSKVIFSYWELEHHRKILRTSIKTQCATTVVTTSLSSTTTKYCRVVKHQKLAN